jgi:hypothetical protein
MQTFPMQVGQRTYMDVRAHTCACPFPPMPHRCTAWRGQATGWTWPGARRWRLSRRPRSRRPGRQWWPLCRWAVGLPLPAAHLRTVGAHLPCAPACLPGRVRGHPTWPAAPRLSCVGVGFRVLPLQLAGLDLRRRRLLLLLTTQLVHQVEMLVQPPQQQQQQQRHRIGRAVEDRSRMQRRPRTKPGKREALAAWRPQVKDASGASCRGSSCPVAAGLCLLHGVSVHAHLRPAYVPCGWASLPHLARMLAWVRRLRIIDVCSLAVVCLGLAALAAMAGG